MPNFNVKNVSFFPVHTVTVMGTFAETALVDYRLSFADQGKQTSVSVWS
jgi:hypothetical protein